MSRIADPVEAFAKAIEIAGSQTKLAKVCGCTQGNISQLIRAGKPLPAEYVLKVEAETGISRHDLRPDLYPVAEPAHASAEASAAPVDADRPLSFLHLGEPVR